MKAQEKEEKAKIKFRYAVALYKALQDSSLQSYRRLASAAGMEPAHIQKIATGKLDITLTTSVAIANAFGITYTDLSAYYDSITEEDTKTFILYLKKQQSIRGNGKSRNTGKKSS